MGRESSPRTRPLNLPMKRPVLHNRRLPNGLHRLANGVMGSFSVAMILVGLSKLVFVPAWLFLVCIPIGLLCAYFDPERFTLVEGLAGEDGYDELDKED